MSLRCATGAFLIAALFALPACKKRAEIPDENDDPHAAIEEQEPNDSREHCDPIARDAALVGTLEASDIDVVCPQGLFSLQIYADASVHIALEDSREQRVELGAANGKETPLQVHLPGKDWVVLLRGQGEWKIESTPAEHEEPTRFCGVQLGEEQQPVILGIQDLPAAFPLCATEAAGAATVRFPSLVPSGVAGFELNVEGADEHTRGSVRILNDGAERIRSAIEPGTRLPRLTWGAEDLIGAEILLSQTDAQKTLYLRIDPVESPDGLTEFLELEPNDIQEQAIAIPRPGSVAGTLYQKEDVDWFRLESSAGEVQVDALTQKDTRLRLQHVHEDQKTDALLGDDGVYRLCSVGEEEATTPHYVRVAYAPDAPVSDGVYQLTFTRVQSDLHPMTPLGQIQVPTDAVGAHFGFQPLQESEDTSEVVPQFGQPKDASNPMENVRRGRLFPPDVEHGWVFQVPETDEDYHVSIELHGKSSMDMKLRVLDADGITVARADRGASGQEERLDMELPTGYYVIAVNATGVRGCEGEYRLEIRSPDSARPQDAANGASSQNTEHRDDEKAPHDEKGAAPKIPTPERKQADQPPSEEIPDYPW